MLNITKKSCELTPVETFLLTKNPNIEKVSDHTGECILVDKWLLYEDVNPETGEVMEILSFMNEEKNVYATNSKSFKEMFLDIVEIMQGQNFTLQLISKKSKNGRNYQTCTLSL